MITLHWQLGTTRKRPIFGNMRRTRWRWRKRIEKIKTLGVVSRKIDMIQHCEALAGMYTKAAEEADQAAKTHRDMLKK